MLKMKQRKEEKWVLVRLTNSFRLRVRRGRGISEESIEMGKEVSLRTGPRRRSTTNKVKCAAAAQNWAAMKVASGAAVDEKLSFRSSCNAKTSYRIRFGGLGQKKLVAAGL